MKTRLVLIAALAGCDPSAGDGPSLEGLPEGIDVEPDGGKADGQPQFAFSTARSVSHLAYPDPDADGEQTWSDEQLREIFEQRVRPGGAAESPWNLVRKAGALGYYGPTGPYGPLGVFGPVGNDIWNPSTLVSGSVPWDDWAAQLEEQGGPLSAEGPLGHRGPLNTQSWGPFEESWDAAHPGSITAVHLRPGGLFSVLGQTGPLSALGPLGPLGPVGAHGFVRDDGGAYLPEGEACSNAPAHAVHPPCRSLELDWDGEQRRVWELVELYDEPAAAGLPDNDTSFVVQGQLQLGDGPDTYRFTSQADQWVTMLVVPEFAKYPPFQAVLDAPDATAGGPCRAPTDGGDISCAPGAISVQLAQRPELDLPETVYVRHALQPWSAQVVGAQFNPFVCNPATFFSNPFCRVSGLHDVYEVQYDHRGSFDDFDLAVDVAFGQVSGHIVSDSGDVLDWIAVKVPAGTVFEASVELVSTWEVTEDDRRWGLDLFIESATWADVFSASDIEFMGSGWRTRPTPRYRLIVVGSSPHTEAGDVAFGGAYLHEL